MKQKLSFATTISTVVLYFIMTSVKNPVLFFTAFILLLVRGIVMFVQSISEKYAVSNEQPATNYPKLLGIRLTWQLASIGMVACTIFVFYLKREVWQHLL